jgi:hypothetical protein
MVTVAASPEGDGIETRTYECLKCHHVVTLAAYKIQSRKHSPINWPSAGL